MKTTMRGLTKKSLGLARLSQGIVLTASLQTGIVLACCNLDDQLQTDHIAEIARATTSIYEGLREQGCSDTARAETSTCSGNTFATWNIVRAIVHTSNELSGTQQGPTEFSLGVDAAGLVNALRANAGEEFSSHETIASGFSNSQLANLTSRISALRGGSSGFSINGLQNSGAIAGKQNSFTSTGLNSGDEAWSKLGGFLNATYSYGNLDPSERADAFDFDGIEINGGLDYRLTNNWVAGAMLAYATRDAEFDSSLSYVNGDVEMKSLSLTPFLLYQAEHWFYTASLGYQSNEFHTNRGVRYTSLNLNIPSPDSVAVSDSDASTLSTAMSAGYSFQLGEKFTLEPSFAVNHQSLTIDEFTEVDKNNTGFNLKVFEQKFSSLETILGIKLQSVYSNDLGVFMPFIDLQAVTQHKTKPRTINAIYANIADNSISTDAQMKLLTDELDSNYGVIGLGVASVLRGARQTTFGSAAGGGIQAFINYRQYVGSALYHQDTISAGLRYEF